MDSYRMTKNGAIVAGALTVTTMTHFRMILLTFQHIWVFRATCKKKCINLKSMWRVKVIDFSHLQWCPPLFGVFPFSFFVINWVSSFSLICSRSRTISLSTLQMNLKKNVYFNIKYSSNVIKIHIKIINNPVHISK